MSTITRTSTFAVLAASLLLAATGCVHTSGSANTASYEPATATHPVPYKPQTSTDFDRSVAPVSFGAASDTTNHGMGTGAPTDAMATPRLRSHVECWACR